MANLEIEIIDLETITEEGLIAAIKENARIYPLMVKDLQKIQEIQAAEQKRRKVPFFQGIVEVDDIKKDVIANVGNTKINLSTDMILFEEGEKLLIKNI